MGGASNEDVSNLKELFDQCDSNNDGGIDIMELDIILQYLNQSPGTEQLNKLFTNLDLDENGSISFSEFCVFMEAHAETPSSEPQATDHNSIVENSFKIFDTDNNGIISLNELDQMMQFLEMRRTEVELTTIMSGVDDDDSGGINLSEYQNLLEKTADAQSEERSKRHRWFSQIDKDDDGLISFRELYFELNRGGDNITPLQVQETFLIADVDKDRQLNFEEFFKLTK